jgi:hypothetical protein
MQLKSKKNSKNNIQIQFRYKQNIFLTNIINNHWYKTTNKDSSYKTTNKDSSYKTTSKVNWIKTFNKGKWYKATN